MEQKKENYQQTIKIPKPISCSAKALAFVSPKLASKFVARLFATPMKHKIPKREYKMEQESIKEKLQIPSLHKEIVVYSYGNSKKKILLVHGWSGRGTQLAKIAEALLEQGYSTISFDGPAHGKSPGKTTNMLEFVDAVIEVDKKHGPFEAAVGHSLGSMTLLNAVRSGLKLKTMVLVGSGDSINDIIYDFTNKLGLKDNIGDRVKKKFDSIAQEDVNNYSASIAAKDVAIPVLLIHDKNDLDSPLESSKNIHKNLANSKLIITEGLGHRKILGDEKVINTLTAYIEKNVP
ncbi:alpha/beta fold hydrolase [Galbibacter mesophilus]|uniref:alpha/beta fold hydrolase n=1 Tax=Galbibacter mesophilus TaxID=379069 RepID=UPI001920248E|nr:alpha/beta hydrolase [Galbibacter mesophilus]MCM5662922.1 alpha/beta hydrolase [Galbibacter mesophilus]